MDKAIFIDKDGDLGADLSTLFSAIGEGLSVLQGFGYKIILISNQPGVAKGLFEEIDLFEFQMGLQELFNAFNLRLDGFYYCPHCPEGSVAEYSISCKCRKPQPGLYFFASHQLNINLIESWIIGDTLKDVEAGKRAGCKTLLVNDGSETEWLLDPSRIPDYITYDFRETAEFIISSGITVSHSL
ncbi:MAG: HAD-IIIA family hydrolase [Candidatus Parcubacteria bacterium]|nr:HAD-IIIA family hydrolase [Candidatus Parcubacteria bacterium]